MSSRGDRFWVYPSTCPRDYGLQDFGFRLRVIAFRQESAVVNENLAFS